MKGNAFSLCELDFGRICAQNQTFLLPLPLPPRTFVAFSVPTSNQLLTIERTRSHVRRVVVFVFCMPRCVLYSPARAREPHEAIDEHINVRDQVLRDVLLCAAFMFFVVAYDSLSHSVFGVWLLFLLQCSAYVRLCVFVLLVRWSSGWFFSYNVCSMTASTTHTQTLTIHMTIAAAETPGVVKLRINSGQLHAWTRTHVMATNERPSTQFPTLCAIICTLHTYNVLYTNQATQKKN